MSSGGGGGAEGGWRIQMRWIYNDNNGPLIHVNGIPLRLGP